jgi:peptidyl-prolyl cis-trans isomerase C
MRRYPLLFLFLALFLTLSGCGKKGEKIIAQVGDHRVTLSEFEKRWEKGLQKEFSTRQEELESRRKTLELIIDDKLMIIGAYEEKINESPDVKRQLEEGKPRFLLQVLYQKEIKDKVKVSKAEVKRYYDKLEFEVKARHILVKTEEEAKKI